MPMLRYPRGVTLGAILLLTPTLALEQQPAARAGPTPARTLLVLSKADQTLAIVDPTTLGSGARAGGAGSARGDRRSGWADSVRLELRFWRVPHAHARRPGAAGGPARHRP